MTKGLRDKGNKVSSDKWEIIRKGLGVKDWFLGVTIGKVFIDLVTTVKCCLQIKILAENILSTRYNTQTNSFDSLSASKWRN